MKKTKLTVNESGGGHSTLSSWTFIFIQLHSLASLDGVCFIRETMPTSKHYPRASASLRFMSSLRIRLRTGTELGYRPNMAGQRGDWSFCMEAKIESLYEYEYEYFIYKFHIQITLQIHCITQIHTHTKVNLYKVYILYEVFINKTVYKSSIHAY